MSSVGIFEKMQLSDGSVYNNVLQVKSTESSAISTNMGNIALGAGAGSGSAPTSDQGTQLLTITFQPLYSTSKILLYTSSFDVGETSNVSDDYRIAAFANTTLLGWRSSGFSANAAIGALNFSYGFHLHLMANSWGTDSRTVQLRFSASGSSTAYTFNNRYSSSYAVAPYRMTIMEIQA